jgi:hypothetical protein
MVHAAVYYQTSNQQFVIGNDRVELTFSTVNASLRNLIDKTTGVDLISRKVGNYNGFVFTYTAPSDTAVQNSGGYLARSITFTPVSVGSGVQLNIRFDQFNAGSATLNLTANLSVTVDNSSPLTTWQLAITNHERVTIQSISLPSISGIGPLSADPANDYLVFPSLSGMLFQDPVHNFAPNRGWGQDYPGGYANMQFLAYYSKESGAGLYLASQDNAGYAKHIAVGLLGADWMEADIAHLAPLQAGADVTVPYSVVLGVFHGDWFDAASVYRSWALEQPWTKSGPLVSRADVPDWLKNSGMIAWKDTLGTPGTPNAYSSLPQAAAVWQQTLQSAPVMDWIGWEKQGPWFNIPDFLPPSQGWPAFDSAASAAHAAGGRLMVEPSTTYATIGAPSWATLQGSATLHADGTMYLTHYDQVDQTGQRVPQTEALMDAPSSGTTCSSTSPCNCSSTQST